MPQNAALARQREHFRRLEAALDSGDHGPRWLAQPAVAAIIDEAPRYRDGRAFHRFASCIMPNHVHLLISLPPRDTQPAPSLTQVLHDLRGYTAWKCNELLGRAGRFWQEESYDRVVRDAREFERTLRYVVSNPVKARLVEGVDQWPWTYVVDQGM